MAQPPSHAASLAFLLSQVGAQSARVVALLPGLDDRIAPGLGARQRQTLAQLLELVAAELGLHPGVHPHLSTRG